MNPSEIPKPYLHLTMILSIDEIFRLSAYLKGREYYFRNVEYEQTEAFQEIQKVFGSKHKAWLVYSTFAQLPNKKDRQVHFSDISRLKDGDIRDTIRREYNGYNATALAIKYGYSDRYVRRLVEGISKSQAMVYDGQLQIEDFLNAQ